MTLSPVYRLSLFLLALALMFTFGLVSAATKASFSVDFDAEPETIGDIKPAFLNFDQESLPSVPVKEIIRRYRRLFNETSVPEVRIDVLHRLTNLEAIYGDQSERSPEEERELYKKALDSYEMIVGTGVYNNRIDELLYQTAKAYDLTEQYEKSLRSLEQLVGLYPNSHLAVEAQFRVGEANFSLGHYKKAEKAYKKSLVNSKDSHFHDKAVFMMGWSQFKQAKYAESGKTFIRVLDLSSKVAKEKQQALLELDGIEGETVRDTFRVLSISFSYGNGAEGVDALLDEVGNREYSYLLYEQLAQHYLAQERYEDSASASRAYINRYPSDIHAPLMSQSIITAYSVGQFPLKVWQEKELFVENYSTMNRHQSNQTGSDNIDQWMHQYLDELSHYYYILAQKAGVAKKESIQDSYYLKAGNYYRQLVDTFPLDPKRGEYSFLAGESFYKINKLVLAIHSYEFSAYQSGSHSFALEAGYAAVLAHNEMRNQKIRQGFKEPNLEQQSHRYESINLFANHFPDDTRTPAILNDLANEYLSAKRFVIARSTSQAVLDHPLASKPLKRSSWLVNGHANFELQDYVAAERAYDMASDLMTANNKSFALLQERRAASIYKQGEAAIVAGDREQAVEQFLRLGRVMPNSSLRPNAQYDAATQLLELKQWRKAITVLKRFQKDFPSHALTETIPDKLIYAYLESGDKIDAADQLILLSNNPAVDPEKSRKALYQAADLYSSAGVKDKSIELLQQYVAKYPKPYDLYIEAHQTMVSFYAQKGHFSKRDKWLNKLIKVDASAGGNRDARSKYLAASARMTLAQDDLEKFESAKLTLPLKKSLKTKSALLKVVVDQLQQVPKYGVAQYTTEATFKLAEVYRNLGNDIMVSERPSSLDELQLEQYDILLEEQAYPFEEKSIAVHEINISRTKDGIYDNWVKESYRILGTIVPARYLRGEKSVGYDRNIQ